MKNYELIAELNKYPAGHEVVFDSIVDDKDLTSMHDEMTQVSKKIECVDFEENRIILC